MGDPKNEAVRRSGGRLSSCCQAEVRFGGGDGPTRYYVCRECEKACGVLPSPQPERPQPDEREDERTTNDLRFECPRCGGCWEGCPRCGSTGVISDDEPFARVVMEREREHELLLKERDQNEPGSLAFQLLALQAAAEAKVRELEGERDEAMREPTAKLDAILVERLERSSDMCEQAQAENTQLREALRELTEGAVQNIIRSMGEKGHPGRPCIRSAWIDIEVHDRAVANINAARAALSPDPQVKEGK